MKQLLLILAFGWIIMDTHAQTNDAMFKTVTCEVRFIEVPRTEINRLLTNNVYTVSPETLRQIDKLVAEKKAVILSQGRIATISGQVAQVKSVREFIYPSEFVDVNGTLNFGGGSPPGVTPNIPTGFKTREVGTILNMTPTVAADGKHISVALTPELSFQATPAFVKHAVTAPGGKVEVSQPDFYTRSFATTVVLKSGATVLLGVHDAVAKEQYMGQENVWLVLLTAAVDGGE